jgi:NADH:ubiquinone oxidoreductase subunit 3 (subunit A)
VAHPLKGGFSRSRLKYIIPGIWIFSALICSPNLYSHRLIKFDGFIYCDVDWSQADIPHMLGLRINFYIIMVLLTGIPFLAVAILYSLIVYKLRKHKLPGEPTSNSVRRRREQQNKNVLKMSVTIVGLLFFSWAFVDIFFVLLLLDKLNNDSLTTFQFIALFIFDLSLTYNFFIYVVFNNIYWQNFRNILSKCLCICSCYRYLKSNCLTKGLSLEENFSQPNAVTSYEHILILSSLRRKTEET